MQTPIPSIRKYKKKREKIEERRRKLYGPNLIHRESQAKQLQERKKKKKLQYIFT